MALAVPVTFVGSQVLVISGDDFFAVFVFCFCLGIGIDILYPVGFCTDCGRQLRSLPFSHGRRSDDLP